MVNELEEQETKSVDEILEDRESEMDPQSIATQLRAETAKDLAKSGNSEKSSLTEKTQELKDTARRLKTIYRIINGASAITVVGLIVTFLLMNVQLIFGNLLKVKFVPALDLWEIIILGLVDITVLAVLFCLIVLITNSLGAYIDVDPVTL